MNVAGILKEKGSDVLTVAADVSVADAAKSLTDRKIGAVVVAGADGGVGGILSERDIVRGVAAHGAGVLTQPVSSLMTAEVVTCSLEDTVDELMDLMTGRRIRHIPVIDDGALKGIISIGDVVKTRIAETEAEANALKEYIATG
ncbi:MAG: CBS domain-containing protein [Alphaproteobacteria bacterium]